MNSIDIRLAGHKATMKEIARTISRYVGSTPLARVEVRYSTQSAERLLVDEVKKDISHRLREHGMGKAQVSVRPHEGQIDDSVGEHVLRLFPSDAEIQSQRHGLLAWLARWFPRWFKPVPAASHKAPQTAATPTQATKSPALSAKEAVTHLRKAVEQACGDVINARATMLHSDRPSLIESAAIVVRLESLHLALSPMVQSKPAQAAKSIGDMVRAQDLSLAPSFTVSYIYKPRQDVEGTSLASESDLEVALRLEGGSAYPVEPHFDDIDSGTALPVHTLMPVQKPVPAVNVQVLGTLVNGTLQPFTKPFELPFATLPARLDRSALAAAGFGAEHPGLLMVASNSCPLTVRRAAGGLVRLEAPSRANGALPMYYRADSLTPLVGEETLSGAALQLVVNDPAGVLDPLSGKTLPALVLELRCAA